MTKIIGGKCDGQESPMKLLQFTEKDETYLLVSFKESNITHHFFMLAGMTPADAMRTYKVREGIALSAETKK